MQVLLGPEDSNPMRLLILVLAMFVVGFLATQAKTDLVEHVLERLGNDLLESIGIVDSDIRVAPGSNV